MNTLKHRNYLFPCISRWLTYKFISVLTGIDSLSQILHQCCAQQPCKSVAKSVASLSWKQYGVGATPSNSFPNPKAAQVNPYSACLTSVRGITEIHQKFSGKSQDCKRTDDKTTSKCHKNPILMVVFLKWTLSKLVIFLFFFNRKRNNLSTKVTPGTAISLSIFNYLLTHFLHPFKSNSLFCGLGRKAITYLILQHLCKTFPRSNWEIIVLNTWMFVPQNSGQEEWELLKWDFRWIINWQTYAKSINEHRDSPFTPSLNNP